MAGKKRKTGKFQADVVKTYHQVSGKPKKSGKKIFSKILIALVVLVLLAALGAGAYLYFFSNITPGLILNNVTILDIPIGGLSEEEASAALQKGFQEKYFSKNMVITLYDQQIEIDPQTAGLKLDTAAVVAKAYSLGRTGTQAERKVEQMQAMSGKLEIDPIPYFSMNEAALQQQIQELCGRFATEVVDGSWEVTGELPDLTTEEPPETVQGLTVTAGTQGYEVDSQAILDMVKEAFLDGQFQVKFQGTITEPAVVDLQEVYDTLCSEPMDAMMDPETFEVSAHAYGYAFDLEEANKLQSELGYGESFSIPFALSAPVTTKAALEAVLFRDVLGSYTAYASSDPYNRDVNLRKSCEAINNIVLMPGEIFSYNPALGKRTPEAGWKQADGYVGKETVKEYGGGICQASSCLYLSAMLADLEIVERVNHGFISSYMPFGMDATVSWGGPEFRFKNTTEYPLRIEAVASGGAVTVKLVGTDTKDYYVRMTYDVLAYDPYETVYEEMPPDNEKGYVDGQVITSGYDGYTIRTYRNKYDKETKELISSKVEATSHYNRRDKVICKIVDPNAPTDPVDPSDPTDPIDPADPADPPVGGGPVTEDGA